MGDQHSGHFYGGQAVIEGVMMRGLEEAAIAVRRSDGQVVLNRRRLGIFSGARRWVRWPLVRGNMTLIESLVVGMAALQFSADVLAAEEQEKQPATDGKQPGPAEEPTGLNRLLMIGTIALSLAFAVGLFIVLPTVLIGLIPGASDGGSGAGSAFLITGSALLKNVVEGGVRLAIILLYIVAISRMAYVRRVFQYHGAEHATINCYESGEPVTTANCLRYSALHPRCGTAFLLVVVLVKIVLGWFFGWPSIGLRILIRVGLLPIVAALAYEIVRWAGRHRDSAVSRALAWPGMLMQKLTTRRPDESQVETAIYALAAIAPGVAPPAGKPAPLLVDARLRPVTEPAEATAKASAQ